MSRLQLIGFLNDKVGRDMTRLIFDYNYTNTTKILVTDQIKYLIQEHKYLLCAAAKAAIEKAGGSCTELAAPAPKEAKAEEAASAEEADTAEDNSGEESAE